MSTRGVCPSYDGVPEYGGPCWTCRGQAEQCPLYWEDLMTRYYTDALFHAKVEVFRRVFSIPVTDELVEHVAELDAAWSRLETEGGVGR